MLGTAIRTAAGYMTMPLRERSRSFREWIDRLLNQKRLHRLIRQQQFPKRVNSVLVVCKGNICRSPLAEAYLRHGFARCGQNVLVFSAGLETSIGKPAHTLAQVVGRNAGIPLDSHATTPLLKEHVDHADLIVAMEHTHYHRLQKLYPHSRGKTFLLRQFSHATEMKNRPLEIADPYSGTLGDFQDCLAIIKQSCDRLISEICRVNTDVKDR
jgi:protein-tyrosine-phosphatase